MQAPVVAAPLSVALVPFTYNLMLTPATDYLFAVTYMNSAATLRGAVQVAETYAAGSAYVLESTTPGGNLAGVPLISFVIPNFSSDFAFTATFNPAITAVPEPGTWALVAGGLGALGLMPRRRKRVG